MPQKQQDIIDTLYPKGDKLSGREVEYLLRSASFICSTYAYHRKILPHSAFKFARIGNVKDHAVFDASHPKAKLHRNAIQGITSDLQEKKIKQFLFGICLESNPEQVVEALKFDFDYDEAALNVLLPNATNVRVTTKWDFSEGLNEVLKRVRIVSDYLRALPTGVKSFVMIQYNKKPKALPVNFAYHNEYDFDRLRTLPLARFPCDVYNTVMTVEIRSKYFDVSEDDIRKDVERSLGVEDEPDSDSNDSTPPPPSRRRKRSDISSSKDDEDDIQVVNDSLDKEVEKPRDDKSKASPHDIDDKDNNDQEVSSIHSDVQETVEIPKEPKISPKRSHSSADFVVDSFRNEPVPKKVCVLSCFNFTPLDNFAIPYEALEGWANSDF